MVTSQNSLAGQTLSSYVQNIKLHSNWATVTRHLTTQLTCHTWKWSEKWSLATTISTEKQHECHEMNSDVNIYHANYSYKCWRTVKWMYSNNCNQFQYSALSNKHTLCNCARLQLAINKCSIMSRAVPINTVIHDLAVVYVEILSLFGTHLHCTKLQKAACISIFELVKCTDTVYSNFQVT